MCTLIERIANVTPDDLNKLVLAFVAVVAMIVGPLLQWWIAKRQAADNVSAKRQVWIDELRKDFAEFLALFARLEDLRRPGKSLSLEDKEKNFEETAAANIRCSELGIRVKLRLNPVEPDHIELLRRLRVLSDACKDPPPDETEEQMKSAQKQFHKLRDDVVGQLQVILKKEWERVKRGKI